MLHAQQQLLGAVAELHEGALALPNDSIVFANRFVLLTNQILQICFLSLHLGQLGGHAFQIPPLIYDVSHHKASLLLQLFEGSAQCLEGAILFLHN